MARNDNYIKLIHRNEWVKLRRQVLTAHPLCQRCEANGRLTAACEVHHVRPVEEAIGEAEQRRLMYDPMNLMALCHRCHVEIHTEMGRSGKVANKQRNDKQIAEVVGRFFDDG